MGGVVFARRRRARATPQVDESDHQIAECRERLVRMRRTGGGVVFAKDRVAQPVFTAFDPPVALPKTSSCAGVAPTTSSGLSSSLQ